MECIRRAGMVLAFAVVLVGLLAAGPLGAAAQSGTRAVRASHILASPSDDPYAARSLPPSDPAWADAEAEALAIATRLRAIADPEERAAAFATIAAEQSDDTVSGADGGDLGAFTREMMVPEFADAIFDAPDPQAGDIIGPARTDYGWHVILYQGEAGDPSASPRSTPEPSPGLTLIDAGSPPLATLRYQPAPDAVARITVESVTDSTVSLQGGEPTANHAGTRMVWDARVTAVEPDGTTRTELTLTEVELTETGGMDAATEDAARSRLDAMTGLSGWTRFDASGKVIESGADIPDGLDPALAQIFEQTMQSFSLVPQALPDEPVGVGARWRSVVPTTASDVAPATTSIIETTLTAIDGTRVTMSATGTVTGSAGTVVLPGMPDGSQVNVLGSSGASSAISTMDLAGLAVESRTTSATTTKMVVELEGQSFPMTTETAIELTITSD